MTPRPEDLQRAWFAQAQADAERGVIGCRLCLKPAGLEAVTTLWRNGQLVFAVCDACATHHHILMTPTERGVEVRAKTKSPVIVRGRG
jgi:hypothetical protein